MGTLLKKYHSIIGIGTFCIAIISISIAFKTTILDICRLLSSENTDSAKRIFALNYLSIIGMFINPIGTGLGIAAILEKGTKKSLAITGFVINTLITIFGFISCIK